MQNSHTSSSLLLLILALGVFGIINTEMGVVGLVPMMAERYGISIAQAGQTVSIFALFVAISAPILPMMTARFRRKNVMLTSLAVFFIANIIAVVTENFTLLLISRAVSALLQPVYISSAFTMAAQCVPQSQAARAVSRVFMGVSAGMVLGVPLTSALASHFSLSAAMTSFAVVNGLVFVATLIWMPSLPAQSARPAAAWKLLTQTPVWSSVLAFTLINGAMFGFFTYIADFLECVSNLGMNAISILLFIYGAGNLIGNEWAGRALSKTNPNYAIIRAPLFLLAAYCFLYFTGSFIWPTIFTVSVLGILTGYASLIGQHLISSSTTSAPEFGNGLFLTAANTGTMAGTAICGIFLDNFGSLNVLWGTLGALMLSLPILFISIKSRTSTAHA